MEDQKTKYAGLTLPSPIIVSSSGLTNSAVRNLEFEKAGAGAIVLKSLFEEQMTANSNALQQESDFPEAADYLHQYIKANETERYLTLIRDTKARCSIPVIASINCYQAGTWAEWAAHLQEAGADAIELNVFALETDIDGTNEAMAQRYVQILKRVKEHVTIPVTIKLSKFTSNLPALVHQLKVNGAAGVVLFNRLFQPDIDLNTQQIVSGNVFSHHSDLSETLRWTAIISGKVPHLDIASSTGVHDWEGVVKCLLAGASAVQMCSAIYTHGPELISQITTCIEEWMHQSHYETLQQFIGKLNYSNITDPSHYERCQFMKYYSNRD